VVHGEDEVAEEKEEEGEEGEEEGEEEEEEEEEEEGLAEEMEARYPEPTNVAALARVRVRSVAAGLHHSLALGCDCRVYSWGRDGYGQLGHGDGLIKPAPSPVEGLEGVCGVTAAGIHTVAVTQSDVVFRWGGPLLSEPQNDHLLPTVVVGFGRVRVRRVYAGYDTAFAIGEAGELFSWGRGDYGLLGHSDRQHQPSPKRVEALRAFS
jgi:alpha-tubulin suppressor-like RCC1 family protein